VSDEHGIQGPDAEELAISRALDLLPDSVDPDTLDPELVADYLEIATSLPFEEIEPPSYLEDRVLAAARAARSTDVETLDAARTRRAGRRAAVTPLRRRLAVVSAAAAVAALLGLGGALVANRTHEDRPIRPTDSRTLAALRAAQQNPASTRFDLAGPSGEPVGRVVVDPDGRGFVYDLRLPAAPAGESYWLWLATTSGPTRVGALPIGEQPQTVEFSVEGPFTGAIISAESSADPAAPTRPYAASAAR
jgi:hypothetical protein